MFLNNTCFLQEKSAKRIVKTYVCEKYAEFIVKIVTFAQKLKPNKQVTKFIVKTDTSIAK